MKRKILKLISILLIAMNCTIKAQQESSKKENRIYTSLDLTVFGPQVSLAYDFYTKNEKCYGFSISQARGLERYGDDATVYYNSKNMRLNFSCRYSNIIFNSKVIYAFYIIKAGVSYNSVLDEGNAMILPSFNVGAGLDIKIVKSGGLRLESGIGAPYFASVGYFFKY
jgi:hypothetical protein